MAAASSWLSAAAGAAARSKLSWVAGSLVRALRHSPRGAGPRRHVDAVEECAGHSPIAGAVSTAVEGCASGDVEKSPKRTLTVTVLPRAMPAAGGGDDSAMRTSLCWSSPCVEVEREGLLVPIDFAPVRLDRAGIVARPAPPDACRRPARAARPGSTRHFGELATVRTPSACNRAAVAVPPHSASMGSAARNAASPLHRSTGRRGLLHPRRRRGLGLFRRELGDQLGAADAHRAGDAELTLDLFAQRDGDRVRRTEQPARAGHVQEGLIEPDRLNERVVAWKIWCRTGSPRCSANSGRPRRPHRGTAGGPHEGMADRTPYARAS